MTTRRQARRIAIDVLFQADVTDAVPSSVLTDWREAEHAVPPFSEELVEGVTEHEPEIDLMLAEHAEGWTVARMAALDRTIMRVAVFELLHRPDVPSAVVVSEAVEAASELSSEESKRFVNGILGRISRELEEEASGRER